MIRWWNCFLGRHDTVFCEGFPILNESCWRCRHCPHVAGGDIELRRLIAAMVTVVVIIAGMLVVSLGSLDLDAELIHWETGYGVGR